MVSRSSCRGLAKAYISVDDPERDNKQGSQRI